MNLKELRISAGLTQLELAKALGYSTKGGYWNIEHGYVKPSVKQLKTLSILLKTPIDQLVEII